MVALVGNLAASEIVRSAVGIRTRGPRGNYSHQFVMSSHREQNFLVDNKCKKKKSGGMIIKKEVKKGWWMVWKTLLRGIGRTSFPNVGIWFCVLYFYLFFFCLFLSFFPLAIGDIFQSREF